MKSWLFFLVTSWLFGAVLDIPVEYDPFHKASRIIQHSAKSHKRISQTEKPLYLYAIFNNQAYINGKFYTRGEQIDGYTLLSIKKNYIILKKGEKIKILPLLPKNILEIRE